MDYEKYWVESKKRVHSLSYEPFFIFEFALRTVVDRSHLQNGTTVPSLQDRCSLINLLHSA